jgi:hypothetical protein
MDDLLDAVNKAKLEYDTKSGKSKARKWLSIFSRRIMLYNNLIDTMAQHHPEYVSLAWGTFKLLFIVSVVCLKSMVLPTLIRCSSWF